MGLEMLNKVFSSFSPQKVFLNVMIFSKNSEYLSVNFEKPKVLVIRMKHHVQFAIFRFDFGYPKTRYLGRGTQTITNSSLLVCDGVIWNLQNHCMFLFEKKLHSYFAAEIFFFQVGLILE